MGPSSIATRFGVVVFLSLLLFPFLFDPSAVFPDSTNDGTEILSLIALLEDLGLDACRLAVATIELNS